LEKSLAADAVPVEVRRVAGVAAVDGIGVCGADGVAVLVVDGTGVVAVIAATAGVALICPVR